MVTYCHILLPIEMSIVDIYSTWRVMKNLAEGDK
jgi:hypothetical protein